MTPNKSVPCVDCGGPITHMYGNVYDCQACIDDMEKLIAKQSVCSHLYSAVCAFFNFQFSGALGSLFWALERAFEYGDYNPKTGVFYSKGYLRQ